MSACSHGKGTHLASALSINPKDCLQGLDSADVTPTPEPGWNPNKGIGLEHH